LRVSCISNVILLSNLLEIAEQLDFREYQALIISN
jgi:hypothetical protein